MNGDEECMTASEMASARRYADGQRVHIASDNANYGLQRGAFTPASTGRRIRPKGEEARHAIGIVLQALECDVSIAALERAVATVKAHLEADA